MGHETVVDRLDKNHESAVTSALCEAFSEYPVMSFVLDQDDPPRLQALVHMFVMARVLRDEPILGAFVGPELAAVAIASYPGGDPAPEEFQGPRADVWRQLGTQAEGRYEAYGEATRAFKVDVPHVHLNMVGVRPEFRGLGLGRRLIDEVQRISRTRPGSQGVALVTENPANVPLYRHLGFESLGHVRVSPRLETWGFFRSN